MSIRLSETQLVMLSAAAQRDDRCLSLAQTLKGAAAQKVVAKLIATGLVKEIKAKEGTPIWRRDDQRGQPFALKLTATGLKAIAIDDSEAKEANEPRKARAAPPARKAAAMKVKAKTETFPSAAQTRNDVVEPARSIGAKADLVLAATTPRRGSKLADVLAMMSRKDGAAIEELMAATDWLPHTTRAALTGLRKRGFQIERRRDEKVTRYWIAGLRSIESAAEESVPSAEGSNAGEETNAAGDAVALAASAGVGAASSPAIAV